MAVAVKTASAKAGNKIVVAKAELRREPSVRKKVVASYEKARAKRQGREIAWAQSSRGGRKPVQLGICLEQLRNSWQHAGFHGEAGPGEVSPGPWLAETPSFHR